MDLSKYQEFARFDDAGNEVANDLAVYIGSKLRLDAGETMLFSRMLEQVKAQVFDKKYLELKGRRFIPVDTSFDPDMERYTFQVADQYVMAKVVTRYTTTLPVVNASMRRYSVEPKEVGDAYIYSDKDVRQALKTGTDLLSRLALACRRGIELAFDEILCTGSPEGQLGGSANSPNVPRLVLPTGNWAGSTSPLILEDLLYLDHRGSVQTNEMFAFDTLLLPPSLYHLIGQKLIGQELSATVLTRALSLFVNIRNVDTWSRLETAGDDGGPRIMVYKRDPEVLSAIIPRDFEQGSPERKGLASEVPAFGTIAGVVIHHPYAMGYADNAA